MLDHSAQNAPRRFPRLKPRPKRSTTSTATAKRRKREPGEPNAWFANLRDFAAADFANRGQPPDLSEGEILAWADACLGRRTLCANGPLAVVAFWRRHCHRSRDVDRRRSRTSTGLSRAPRRVVVGQVAQRAPSETCTAKEAPLNFAAVDVWRTSAVVAVFLWAIHQFNRDFWHVCVPCLTSLLARQ
jgi:hypothetical protein